MDFVTVNEDLLSEINADMGSASAALWVLWDKIDCKEDAEFIRGIARLLDFSMEKLTEVLCTPDNFIPAETIAKIRKAG